MKRIRQNMSFVGMHRAEKAGRLFLLAIMISLIVINVHGGAVVRAYGSWVTDTSGQNIYGVAPIGGTSTPEDGTSTDTFTKKILNFCLKLPDGIRNALTGDGYNFSLDGIILGRLAVGSSGNSVNYTGFDMSNGNLYGTVGAVIYKTLRAVVLGGMLLMYMYMLATHVFKSGEKSRAELKEALMRLVIMFLLIYIMPQLIDIVIYLRDFVLNLVYKGMTSSNMVNANNIGTNAELITEYRNMAYSESGFGFFTFLLYLGVCVGCIFFLWEYMKIAIIQMMLFAIYPIVALLSVHNKKLFADWWAMFFSNCLIPVMDYSLLLIPVFIGEAMGEVHPFLASIMQVAIIAQTVPARNAMLRIFSNATGIATGGGFGGLGMLGMMAMASLRRRAFSAGVEGSEEINSNEAEVSQRIAESFKKEFPGIPELEQKDMSDSTREIMDTISNTEDIMAASDESVKNLVADTTEESTYHGSETEGDYSEEASLPTDTTDTFEVANDTEVENAEEQLNVLSDGHNNVLDQQLSENEISQKTSSTPPVMEGDNFNRQIQEILQNTTAEDAAHIRPSSGNNPESVSPEMKRGRAYSRAVGERSYGLPQQNTTENNADKSNQREEPESLHRFNTLRMENLERLDRAKKQAEGLQNSLYSLNETHKGKEVAYAEGRAAYESAVLKCNSSKLNYERVAKEHGLKSNEAIEAREQFQSAENTMHEKHQHMEMARKDVRNSQADVDRQKATIEANRSDIKKAEAQEEKYVNIAKQYGMRDIKYSSAEEFKRQRKLDDIKRAHANYKNFNSGEFKNSLSPEEKAAFSRERQLHEKYRKVSKTATVAGVLAGTAAGMIVGSFGGEKGMKTSAMVGGTVMGGAVAGTSKGISSGHQIGSSTMHETESAHKGATRKGTGNVGLKKKVDSAGNKKAEYPRRENRTDKNRTDDISRENDLDRRAEEAARTDPEISRLL